MNVLNLTVASLVLCATTALNAQNIYSPYYGGGWGITSRAGNPWIAPQRSSASVYAPVYGGYGYSTYYRYYSSGSRYHNSTPTFQRYDGFQRYRNDVWSGPRLFSDGTYR